MTTAMTALALKTPATALVAGDAVRTATSSILGVALVVAVIALIVWMLRRRH